MATSLHTSLSSPQRNAYLIGWALLHLLTGLHLLRAYLLYTRPGREDEAQGAIFLFVTLLLNELVYRQGFTDWAIASVTVMLLATFGQALFHPVADIIGVMAMLICLTIVFSQQQEPVQHLN